MKKSSRRVLKIHVRPHQTVIAHLLDDNDCVDYFFVVQLGRLRRWERSGVLDSVGDHDPLRNRRSSVLGTTPAAGRQWCVAAQSDPHKWLCAQMTRHCKHPHKAGRDRS